MKITVVGAGAVGASCAEYIAIKNFASEVVLLDIKEGFAEGKAMDLMQCASLNGFDTKITGSTNDYSITANSDICVITSGIPRKPGMTREELIGINAGIVKTVSTSLVEYSPNTVLIVVSNPMDTMTYLAHKVTGLPKHKIIGMGGALAASHAAAKQVFEEVNDALGENLFAIMQDGPDDAIRMTRNAQPALFATSMAAVRVIEAELGAPLTSRGGMAAGHSLGEYAALAASGSLSISDAARLLRQRGDSMQSAVPVGEGAMAAILGAMLRTFWWGNFTTLILIMNYHTMFTADFKITEAGWVRLTIGNTGALRILNGRR